MHLGPVRRTEVERILVREDTVCKLVRCVENAAQARPDLEEQIANDPQVAQLKKILGALGGAQDGQLKMALGFRKALGWASRGWHG